MIDSYGRTIEYMRVSITDRCNLRCNYCMPNGIKWKPMDEILTYEEIISVCKAAAKEGVRKLKVTGGEPLVRKGCVSLIRNLKEIPGIEQVTLTTNGVYLDQYAEELLDAGIDGINVSLDSLREDTYEKITNNRLLQTVLSGIDTAYNLGIPLKINVVPQRGVNDEELISLAMLSKDRDIDVKFIELMPIGGDSCELGITNEEILTQFTKYFGTLTMEPEAKGNGPAVYYRIPEHKGMVGFISAVHNKFCGQCNRVRLTSTGLLKPCLCFDDCYDVKQVLRAKDHSELELKSIIRNAIMHKPSGHQFEILDAITKERMSQIGG